MPSPRAILFDMDGLLIDSEPLWRRAEVEVFGRVGLVLDESDCFQTTGLRIDEVAEFWFQRSPWRGPSPGEVARQIVARVIELVRAEGAPKEGVAEALSFAAGRGVPVALVSSSPYALINATLDRLQLRASFSLVYSAEDEPFGKPHPGVYLSAASRLGVPPRACLALEDSLNGLIAAKAARMLCLAVPEPEHRHDPRFSLADHVIPSLLSFSLPLWSFL